MAPSSSPSVSFSSHFSFSSLQLRVPKPWRYTPFLRIAWGRAKLPANLFFSAGSTGASTALAASTSFFSWPNNVYKLQQEIHKFCLSDQNNLKKHVTKLPNINPWPLLPPSCYMWNCRLVSAKTLRVDKWTGKMGITRSTMFKNELFNSNHIHYMTPKTVCCVNKSAERNRSTLHTSTHACVHDVCCEGLECLYTENKPILKRCVAAAKENNTDSKQNMFLLSGWLIVKIGLNTIFSIVDLSNF